MLCTLFTLVTFTWYIIENFFRNRKYLPKPIKMYVNGLRATEAAISKLVNSMKNKMKPTKKTELTEVEDVPESSPAEKINQPNQV
jgi:hypothetical protein